MRETEWQSRPFVQELRQNQTPEEKKLWQGLRARRLAGFKFRRQRPIEYFIVDFACLSEKLIIEVDGESHRSEEAIAYDQRRTHYLNPLGWHVLRFSNDDIHHRTDGVVEIVFLYLKGEVLVAPPSAPCGGTSPVNGARGHFK